MAPNFFVQNMFAGFQNFISHSFGFSVGLQRF